MSKLVKGGTMETISRNGYEFDLSEGQLKLFKLFKKAYGKAIIWEKKGKIRVLDPTEIHIF